MKTRMVKKQINTIAAALILVGATTASVNVAAITFNGTQYQGRLLQGQQVQGQQVQGQQVQGQQVQGQQVQGQQVQGRFLQGVDIEKLQEYAGTINDKSISGISAKNGQLIIRLQ